MEHHSLVIVLINYNSLSDTVECLGSIENASKSSNPLVVVVENASKDCEHIDTLIPLYKNLQILKSRKNIGFGQANNLAIEWIRENVDCDYVFLLNNDTIVDPQALEKLTEAMEHSDADTVMVAPKILVYPTSEVWYGGGTINYRKITPNILEEESDCYTDFASGCCMFFRAEYALATKGFDPFFFMYDEDVELSIRLRKAGKKIRYIAGAIVHHKCQGSQTKQKDIPSNQLDPRHPNLLFYLNNTIENRRFIINKHLTGLQGVKASLFHTIYWLLKGFQYLLHSKTNAFRTVIQKLFSPLESPVKKYNPS